jgi:hypothetical protein
VIRERTKSGLLWGLVGALAFLVLTQGYVLVVGPLPLGLPGRIGLAALLGALVAGVAYATEHRLARKGRS